MRARIFFFKFGWKYTDFDLLASGSLAGHLIECGAQVTGGIFTDWDMVDGWDNIGKFVVKIKALNIYDNCFFFCFA